MSTLVKWEKRIDKFQAKAESGVAFQIEVYQEVVGNTDTVKRANTAEGYYCEIIDRDTVEIVDLDLTVRRV